MGAPYTAEEQENIATLRRVLDTLYSPKASSAAVKDMLVTDTELVAPTQLPDIKDIPTYADMHTVHLRQTPDLRITDYKTIFAKNDDVFIHYAAAGTHSGEDHNGIPASGRKAQWTVAACAHFTPNHKLKRLAFELDKAHVWKSWGWTRELDLDPAEMS